MSVIEALSRLLVAAIPENGLVVDPADIARYAVDGVVPGLVILPGSDGDIARVLAGAAAAGAAVIPWGGGTRMGRGHVPAAYDVAVSTSRLDRIVDHDVANLTVTVQAGLSMARLQTEMARSGQFLPIDVPLPDLATAGGVVASNTNGPGRLRYGSVRDLVLGLRAAMPSGDTIHVGGKTVKNVAGYDMTRLLIGSYGTLGIVTEVTFRLLPLPARSAAVCVEFEHGGGAFDLAARILSSVLLPTHLTVLSRGTGTGACILVIRVDGSPETVNRQVRDMTTMARDLSGGVPILITDDALRSLDWEIRDFGATPVTLAATCTVPLSSTSSLVQELERAAEAGGLRIRYAADAGIGAIRVSGEGTEDDAATEFCARLVEAADRLGGHFVLDRAQPAVKRETAVWGKPRDDWKLSAEIKRRLDPNRTLNPGRFAGGI